MGHKGAYMGRDGRRNRLIIWLAAAGYLVALALIAAWPSPVDAPVNAQLMAFFDALHRRGVPQIIGYNLLEFAANVVLFIPCGLLLAHLLRSWVPAVLLGGAPMFKVKQFSALEHHKVTHPGSWRTAPSAGGEPRR